MSAPQLVLTWVAELALEELPRPRSSDEYPPRHSLTGGQGAHEHEAKNTICLWFKKDAHDAARFYAATFPNSEVTAVFKAPSDCGGKQGDVLTVDFTVLGIWCLGLNGGPEFKHSEAFRSRSRRTRRKRPTVTGTRWRQGKSVQVVQGPLGPVLADHSARALRGARGWWR